MSGHYSLPREEVGMSGQQLRDGLAGDVQVGESRNNQVQVQTVYQKNHNLEKGGFQAWQHPHILYRFWHTFYQHESNFLVDGCIDGKKAVLLINLNNLNRNPAQKCCLVVRIHKQQSGPTNTTILGYTYMQKSWNHFNEMTLCCTSDSRRGKRTTFLNTSSGSSTASRSQPVTKID